MPLYAYTGQNAATGKKIKATVEAESIKDARTRLRKQNIYVMTIAQSDSAMPGEKKTLLQTLRRQPPRQEDIALSTRQFAILVNAAVDISDALKSVSEQVENAELRSIYVKIREQVSEGKSLSDAHRLFPDVFNSLYVNMIAAAEKAGALPVVLRRLSDFITYQIEIKRKVVGALTYPAIMVLLSAGITIFLFVNVLPKMTKAFASLKVTLPWYTIMLNAISAWLQAYWVTCIGATIVAGIAGYYWSKTPRGRLKIDTFMLTAPIIGPVIQRVTISRFAKTLSTVLSSGVRIVEALTLTKGVVGNVVLEEAIEESIRRVQDGEKLAMALERTHKFPAMVIHMLKTGDKTGKSEEMLTNVADAYDEEVDHKISQSTKLIEPFMMIFIAGLVILIVMSVMGPMMQAMNSLK